MLNSVAQKPGMGSHQSSAMMTDSWLTPPELLSDLGAPEFFDLDPCASLNQPWPTARKMLTVEDDGLSASWTGNVWMNPPYGRDLATWLNRLADHGKGQALIFARTETRAFFSEVWPRADAVLFIRGRLHFHRPDGSRSSTNAGAPSCLVLYGEINVEKAVEIAPKWGKIVHLRGAQNAE